MRKILKGLATLLVFLLMTVAMTSLAAATDIGFSVTPSIPQNQREGISGYFDLMVQPGQTQDLTLTVSNQSAEDMVVLVEAVTAFTNRNGVVDYSASGASDKTLKHSFADLAQIAEKRITVPAQSSKDIIVTVAMPQESYDGILLGAVRVLKELTEEEKNSGATIINQYSYVIAVKLAESAAAIPPDFTLGEVTAELINYKASIVANICNPQPKLIKGAAVNAKIYPKGDPEPIMELTKKSVDFAPNSIFPFSMVDEAGYGIQAGSYVAKINLQYEGQSWDFEQEFEIKAEEAANLNEGALNQTQQRQTATGSHIGLPFWAMIAIAAGVLIVAGVVIYTVVQRRQYAKFMEEMNKRYNKKF